MHSASHYAKEEVIREDFADVVGGWQYLSTLDRRTCLACAGYDGTIFDVDEDKPVLPLHWNCRCTYIPLPKEIKGFPRLTEGTRPAVKDITDVSQFKGSYNEWLTGQLETDPEFVLSVLGPSRFELFQKGKISLSAMSTHGRIKRLSELPGL
jgi:hypothetical protein